MGKSFRQLVKTPRVAVRMFYHVYVTGQPRQGLVLELKHKMGQLRFAAFNYTDQKQERRSHRVLRRRLGYY